MNASLSVAGLSVGRRRSARVPLPRLAGTLALAATLATVPAHADAPPLPSSRFGSVEVAGAPAAPGTVVSAHFGGTAIASAPVFADGGSRYRLDVPGDRPDTPAIEGPLAGQSFEIRVAGAPATTAVWTEGTFVALDLAAAAGADLAVTLSDGLGSVLPSQVLTFTLSADNPGTIAASGVHLVAGLPADAVFVSASGGGTALAGEVSWPLFSLAPATSVTRTFSVRLSASVAPGIDTVTTTARISHDGAAGGDPQPANDQSSDIDALAAAPDLVAALDDGRSSVAPGETIFQRLRVTNAGSQDATGVVVALELPSGAAFYSASHGGTLVGNTVTFPAVGLASGAALTRAVTVRVPADLAAGITALAFAGNAHDDGANGTDPSPDDNSAGDLDTVAHAPDLTVESLAVEAAPVDPQTLAISGEVTVEFRNRGTLAANVFTLALFEDLDRNGAFSRASDRILGETVIGGAGVSEVANVTVTVAGVLELRDDRIFAVVDADGALAEIDETNNVGSSGESCGTPGDLSSINPVVEMAWPPASGPAFKPLSVDSLSTPIVVQLTDDNGDGRWDDNDIPDIVFVTANLAPTFPPEPDIVLRAIRGDSGAPIWNVPGLFTSPPSFFSMCGLAAGDIDGDGKVEIVTSVVTPDGYGFLQAYEHNGAFKWRSQTYDTHPFADGTSNRDNPSLADLDGDGDVEIVVGAFVFDSAGHRLWAGSGGQAYQTQRNNQRLGGAISVVADVDLDGFQEIVTGNTLYRHDGTIVWQRPEADGYPAVLNADADPQAEIVVVSRGFVRLHDTDGSILWGPLEMPGSDPESGGPPSVGDLDGDGEPEIVVAGSDILWALHLDGTPLWQASTRDYSSSQTGAALFDFDGDGAYEVVYRDERELRIYRGADGTVLYSQVFSSTTMVEMPVVADVDRDGNAEIVVTSDHAWDYPVPPGGRTAGLVVLGDGYDGWVGARSIWNQHAYSIDNVAANGGIPAHPAWGWLEHETFRANAGPAPSERASADVTAGRLFIDASALPLVRATVRVGNAGPTPIAPGLEVLLFDAQPFTVNPLATGTIPVALVPGAYFDLTLSFDAGAGVGSLLTVVVDPGGMVRECNESNNEISAGLDVTALGMWVTLTDGTSGASPGDLLTYAVTVHNAFAFTATGVVLTDTLPAGLQFVAASDGGSESAGTVTWPAFALASGAATTRTVSLRVDPALSLGVTSLTNRVTVADDGAHGADPTPANNQATDTDQVVSVVAHAGGPYSGSEGSPIVFDASSSLDRDGGVVLFAWDVDGDGAFDDGNAATVSHAFEDEGSYIVRLRVTDDEGEVDLDEAAVTIANVAPQVLGPATIAGTEGGRIDISAFRVVDPGVLDYGLKTVDWGDGTADYFWIEAGVPQADHVYPEDGSFTIEVCADDGDGGSGCATSLAAIGNEAPQARRGADIGFTGWLREELGGGTTSRWAPAADLRAVTEELNGEPSFLVGELPGYGTSELTLSIRENGDDDFVGLAVGFEPGDSTRATAEYLLIDWKQGDQSGARRGLALSRVVGIPSAGELWVHQDLAANGTANRVVELQRGAHFGAAGWARQTEYRLRVEATPTRLRLYIDGRLELDYSGPVPNGALALYDFSQAGARFGGGIADSFLTGREGDLVGLRVAFSDAGIEDTHTATIAWGDGDSTAGTIAEEEGHGEVGGEHAYRDDGDGSAAVCVTDDEGSEDCVDVPVAIDNAAPVLALVLPTLGYVEDAVSLAGSGFTDPGIDDTHQVVVVWGDGESENLPVAPGSGGAGSWSFGGSHLYAAPGTYEIAVCVRDDDGGESCDTRDLTLVYRALDLRLTMSAAPVEARPGQNVVLTLRVENAGTLPAAGVVLTDVVPAGLTFVGATLGGVNLGGTVTWNLGTLAPGGVVSPTVTLQVPATAPFGGSATSAGTVSDDGASGPDAHPGDNAATATVTFSDALTPIVAISGGGAAWSGNEGTLLALSGVSWNDTTAGQTHTGTIAWGDGATTAATLTPANGTAGAVGGSHVYAQDGVYTVEICVRDATARVGCRTSTATIANLAPDVVEPGSVDLHSWIEEEYETADVSALWTVAADGLSVYQSINSQPSVFFSPLPAIGSFLEGTIRVESPGTWDDDYIGFVLGFQAGDSLDPGSDFLVVDWKQQDQTGALRGLAVSRVLGAMGEEFWAHSDSPANGSGTGVFEIARAATLSRTGWSEGREYRFRFETTADRLKIWVDDVLQFDLAVAVPPGKFGFYNYSQEAVRYRGFTTGLQQRFEGETFELAAPFIDPGVLDLHSATIDWDDGASAEADAVAEEGFGVVAASHAYSDDGDFLIETCVADDAGARSCGRFPLLVLNRPPVVAAAPNGIGFSWSESEFALATFTDAGVLDSHLATVDWGDGTSGPAVVDEDAGSGTVAASHLYELDGIYPVQVCVTDDDGATACASLSITVGSSPPIVRADKTATIIDRDGDGRTTPGDDIVYRIEIFNEGPTTLTAVRLVDPIPAYTALVEGSVYPEIGLVETEPLTVEVDPIDPGSSVVVQFAVTITSPLPAGVAEIVNSGSVTSAEAPPQPTDDPALPGMNDPTRTPVFVSPGLAASKSAAVIDLDGDGVASRGDEIAWTLVVRASGDTAAGGVLVQDAIDEHLALVPGSLVAPGAHVLSIHPLTLVYDVLPVGATVEASFRTAIDPALAPEVESVANQATVLATGVDAFLSDDPATPVAGDPTVVPVFIDPTLTVSAVSVAEGNAGSTAIAFPVALDRPARLATSVAWTVEGVTAVAGEDFVAAAGTLAIPVGAATAEIVVQGLGDLVVENDELLRLVLSAPVHAELAVSEAFATLLNDDAATLAIGDATVEEGGVATFTVELSAPSAFPVSVDFAAVDGSAVAGGDYTPVSGTLLFAPFETSQSVVVATVEDAVAELTESFTVMLANAGGAAVADGSGSGTILDDDTVVLTIANAAVVEGDSGDSELALPITLSAPTFGAVEVDVTVTAGSATEGSDYSAVGGHLTIPAGQTEAWVVVVVHGDLIDESDETVLVTLANVAGATLGAATATGTIVDDDEATPAGCRGPNLLVNGGAESGPEGCTISGWSPISGDWRLEYLPVNLPADPQPAEGSGYIAGRRHAGNSQAAELRQSVSVEAFAERIDSGEQAFALAGSLRSTAGAASTQVRLVLEYLAANGTTVLESFDSGWIWSDDEWQEVEDERTAPTGTRKLRLRLYSDSASADGYFDALELRPVDTTVLTTRDLFEYEGQSGLHDAWVPLDVSCPADFPIGLTYVTANGTAQAPGDYSSRSGTLTLPPASLGTTVPVPIKGDTVSEPTESFELRLTGTSLGEAVLLDGVSSITILDDDFCRRSPGYWKTHRSSWPVDHLTLGAVDYDASAMMSFLDYGGPDGATRLGRHLVATKLNLAKGSHPWIVPTVTAADLFLIAHPPGSAPTAAALTEANALKDQLDFYNNSGCQVP